MIPAVDSAKKNSEIFQLLRFLDSWRPLIESFHIIFLDENDILPKVMIPTWASYELYNYEDINRALGNASSIFGRADGSILSFGYLVSDKKIIISITAYCEPPHYVQSKHLTANEAMSILLHPLHTKYQSPLVFHNRTIKAKDTYERKIIGFKSLTCIVQYNASNQQPETANLFTSEGDFSIGTIMVRYILCIIFVIN